ncbi:MAG: hypothetical protein H0X33_00945 [Taibaiella sp.]|nr:hypothetical protein [Taibaiella sp.]
MHPTSISTEKKLLQVYRDIAGDVIENYSASIPDEVLSTTHSDSTEQQKKLHTILREIDAELKDKADNIMAAIHFDRNSDILKLKEQLFIIRKDYFNDFMKKAVLCY